MKTGANSAQRRPATRGRPREFAIDDALDKAIPLFRERGYAATSIGDLTAAMDVASGSIYKAFKDKRSVFLAAFDRYTALRARQVENVVDPAVSGREQLRDVLAFYVASSRGGEGRRGCLVVASAVELAIHDPEVAARVTASLANNETFLAGLIRRGQADGSVDANIDATSIARVMVCLTQGLRVVGKTGRSLPPTPSIVDVAMKLLA